MPQQSNRPIAAPTHPKPRTLTPDQRESVRASMELVLDLVPAPCKLPNHDSDAVQQLNRWVRGFCKLAVQVHSFLGDRWPDRPQGMSDTESIVRELLERAARLLEAEHKFSLQRAAVRVGGKGLSHGELNRAARDVQVNGDWVEERLAIYFHGHASSLGDFKAAVRAVVESMMTPSADVPPAVVSEGEGEKPKPNATTEAILPVLLSAPDIASRINRKRESVTSFLTRFAEKHPGCRVENKPKRKNEPGYLYRTAEVWPALERWMKGNEKS